MTSHENTTERTADASRAEPQDAPDLEAEFTLARGGNLDPNGVQQGTPGRLFTVWGRHDLRHRLSFYAQRAATNSVLRETTIRLPLETIAPELLEPLDAIQECVADGKAAPVLPLDLPEFERAVTRRIYHLMRFWRLELVDDPVPAKQRAEMLDAMLDGGDYAALPMPLAYSLIDIADNEGRERDECLRYYRSDDLGLGKFWGYPRPKPAWADSAEAHLRRHREVARSWRNLAAFITATLDEIGRRARLLGHRLLPKDHVPSLVSIPAPERAFAFASEYAVEAAGHPDLRQATIELYLQDAVPALSKGNDLDCSEVHKQGRKGRKTAPSEFMTMLRREIGMLEAAVKDGTSENPAWDEQLANRLAPLAERDPWTLNVPVPTVPDLIRSCVRNAEYYESCSELTVSERERQYLDDTTAGCGMGMVDYMFDHREIHHTNMQSWLDLAAYLAARLDALGRHMRRASRQPADLASESPEFGTSTSEDLTQEAA